MTRVTGKTEGATKNVFGYDEIEHIGVAVTQRTLCYQSLLFIWNVCSKSNIFFSLKKLKKFFDAFL